MRRVTRPHWLIFVLPLAAGSAGYLGPWLPHRAAGLTVLGLDLAEYVQFLPSDAVAAIAAHRQLFYLPLLVASLSCTLLASRQGLSVVFRVLLAMAAIPLALAMLPPAWSPGLLATPEVRLQSAAITLCIAMLPGIAVTRYLSDSATLTLLAVLSVPAALWPTLGYLGQVRPVLSELYRQPLALGWGFWACMAGFLGIALVSVVELLRTSRRR